MEQAGTQTELKELLVQYAPSSDKPSGALWCDPEFLTVSKEKILIPFTCDYCVQSLGRLITKGQEVYGKCRFLKIIGDATHNKTREKLKVAWEQRIGIPGAFPPLFR